MKIKTVIIALIFLCLMGCSGQLVPRRVFSKQSEGQSRQTKETKAQRINLACWNVQTFFDAETAGTEYQDFKSNDKWNREKYLKRLETLCTVMTTLNPDIFVMEEIENEAVIHDISNHLSTGAWDKKKGWQYACFAKEEGSAIGCAVFSRFELHNMKVHSMDIRSAFEAQPSTRPLIQIDISSGEKDFVLFVNHWKSKSGGQEETELWRDWQEGLLAQKISELKGEDNASRAVVICGDFNRSAEDFIPYNGDFSEKQVIDGEAIYNSNVLFRKLRLSDYETEQGVAVYNPWFRNDGSFYEDGGSYYYNGSWERIDNIFTAGNIEIENFSVYADSPVADENGIPQGYKVYNGKGCSDHLPLKCVLVL